MPSMRENAGLYILILVVLVGLAFTVVALRRRGRSKPEVTQRPAPRTPSVPTQAAPEAPPRPAPRAEAPPVELPPVAAEAPPTPVAPEIEKPEPTAGRMVRLRARLSR